MLQTPFLWSSRSRSQIHTSRTDTSGHYTCTFGVILNLEPRKIMSCCHPQSGCHADTYPLRRGGNYANPTLISEMERRLKLQ